MEEEEEGPSSLYWRKPVAISVFVHLSNPLL